MWPELSDNDDPFMTIASYLMCNFAEKDTTKTFCIKERLSGVPLKNHKAKVPSQDLFYLYLLM